MLLAVVSTLLALLFSVLACILFKVWLGCKLQRNPDEKAGFIRGWINNPPYLLGIGLLLKNIYFIPWYWFPYAAIHEEVSASVYGVFAQGMCAVCGSIFSGFCWLCEWY